MNKQTSSFTFTIDDHKIDAMPLLDWLRFFLASIVILDHSGIRFPGPITGGLAVDVFLALSGWLVGGIVLRVQRTDLPRFYFNRATRIWVPYFTAVCLVYGLAAVRDGIDLNWAKYLFYDTTFTHITFTEFPRALSEMPLEGTGNHFWSISVEEQFYLLVPLAIILPALVNKAVAWVLVAAALVVLGGQFLPIAAGLAAAGVQRYVGNWHLTLPGRIFLLATALATFALMSLGFSDYYLKAVFAASVVLLLSVPGERSMPGLFLGAISFPMYLNAWIGGYAAHEVAKRLPMPSPALIALAYAGAVSVGIVAWWVIDRNIMARRSAWYSRPLGLGLCLMAYSLLAIGLLGGISIKLNGG